MASGMAEAVRQLIEEKGISEDLIRKTLQDALLAAYKKKYGSSENADIRIRDKFEGVDIYATKRIVLEDDLEDPSVQISLEEARTYSPDAEVGDDLEVAIDPKEFDLQSVMLAKQTTRQSLREISRDTLFAEYSSKVGEIIIGYYQREKNGAIFVDLGRIEGILLKKNQSPRETYHPGDRIKALIVSVKKAKTGLEIQLSRTESDFVKKILELEVPEIYDGTVEIFKIVREPGFRTKIAVSSRREDIDPVGACVGLKGIRIQSIIRELEGEKVDILRYDIDPRRFIKNALSPAEIRDVYILDESKNLALAVVADNQLSIAIGKQGLNVKLANRLSGWNIDVKTDDQVREMEASLQARRAVSELFNDEPEDEVLRLSDLPGADPEVLRLLAGKDIIGIEDFLNADEDMLASLEGLDPDALNELRRLVEENVEVVEEVEEGGSEASDEGFVCPDCGEPISSEMQHCPKCGVELSFEYEDDQQA